MKTETLTPEQAATAQFSESMRNLKAQIDRAEKWIGEQPCGTKASAPTIGLYKDDLWLTSRRDENGNVEICTVPHEEIDYPDSFTPIKSEPVDFFIDMARQIPDLLEDVPAARHDAAGEAELAATAISGKLAELGD